MWQYPEFDPVAVQLGPLAIHWYAISYLVGIGLVWWTLKLKRDQYGWTSEQLSDLITIYGILGIIIGGRMGYMLFYGLEELAENPLSLFKVWQGGMSFHGGMIGVMVAGFIYARKHQRTFFSIGDFIAPSIPLALGCGRIGNFINGELPGRVTELPWAVVFPGESVGRHPSSVYQALIEGPILFAVLWIFASKPRPAMAVSALFLIGYGLFRTLTEFFRTPDAHLGFVAFGWVTAGQLLSLPMVLCGIVLMVISYARQHKGENTSGIQR